MGAVLNRKSSLAVRIGFSVILLRFSCFRRFWTWIRGFWCRSLRVPWFFWWLSVFFPWFFRKSFSLWLPKARSSWFLQVSTRFLTRIVTSGSILRWGGLTISLIGNARLLGTGITSGLQVSRLVTSSSFCGTCLSSKWTRRISGSSFRTKGFSFWKKGFWSSFRRIWSSSSLGFHSPWRSWFSSFWSAYLRIDRITRSLSTCFRIGRFRISSWFWTAHISTPLHLRHLDRIMIHEREGMPFDHWNSFPDELLDISKVFFFFRVRERKSRSLCSRSTGSSDTVHVGFCNIRDFIVDDELEGVHIDPTSGDIGGDEDSSGLILEALKGSLTSILSFIPVDSIRGNAIFEEDFDDFIGSMLRPSKDECGFDSLILEYLEEEVILIPTIHEVDSLLDDIDRRRNRSDGHFRGLMEDRMRELHNLRRHGRWEKEGLALFRKDREELLHVVDKSHIEHPIRFIEDENLDIGEGNMSLIHEVQESTRCRDKDIHTTSEWWNLSMLSHSTKNHCRTKSGVPSICLETLVDLDREFTSWGHDEGSYMALAFEEFFLPSITRSIDPRSCREKLKDRKGKSRRFPSSGLCTTEEIRPLKNDRNSLSLDRGWSRIFLFFEGSEEGFDKFQFWE